MVFVIAALIVIGLALVIVEIIFVPGTTVVGVFGIIFVVAGVYFSFKEYGSEIGTYVLLGTAVSGGVLMFWSFRSGAWKRFSLTSSMEGRVNEGVNNDLQVGDEGTTVSSLRPIGSAEFKDKRFEVRTNGDYLASGTKVRISKILDNYVVVEPIN
jgi:membrane-bound ClpP family serine protease